MPAPKLRNAKMRSRTPPPLLLLLLLLAVAATAVFVDICNHESCACDGFSAVRCSCLQDNQELTIQSNGTYRLIPTTTRLEIYGCSRVYVSPKAVSDLQELKRIKIVNVDTLYISEYAFEWFLNKHWGLTITIENTTIPDLPSYLTRGRIDELRLKFVHINMMHSFAISSISDMKHVEIANSVIDRMDTQVFKKIIVNSILIANNTFNNLPSRTFSDVTVYDSFAFNNNKVSQMRSSFLIGDGFKRITMEGNTIEVMEGECLKAVGEGNVFINNNVIGDLKSGAFIGLKVHRDVLRKQGLKDLYLQNNTVNKFQLESFVYNTSSYKMLPSGLFLDRDCDCGLWQSFRNTELNNAIYCNNIRGNRLLLNVYKDDNCENNSINMAIMIIGIFVAIIAVVILVLIAVYMHRRSKKRVMTCKEIKPDGKTYKETELYFVVEKTDLLTTDF